MVGELVFPSPQLSRRGQGFNSVACPHLSKKGNKKNQYASSFFSSSSSLRKQSRESENGMNFHLQTHTHISTHKQKNK